MRTTEAITKLRKAGYGTLADELDDGEITMAEAAAALRASDHDGAGELADELAPSGKATLSGKAADDAGDASKRDLSGKGDDDDKGTDDDDDKGTDDDDDKGTDDDDSEPKPDGAPPAESHWATRPAPWSREAREARRAGKGTQ